MTAIPTIGRIVLYKLTAAQAEAINRSRDALRRGRYDGQPTHIAAPGAQLHCGNEVSEGDEYPMIITRVWGEQPDSYVNGQVMLDGNDLLWATSVKIGEGTGSWRWPVRT